jgi:ubiquinol-cytochrome c reductase iron-sulfur subunit
MSNDGVNAGRRRFLVAATSVVGAAGAVGAAVPFVGSWFPSAKAKAAGAPVKVNIAKVEPGQQMVAEWRGQPVFIVRRTEEILGNLKKLTAELSDPESKASVQPAYVDPQKCARSSQKSCMLVGLCTHLGCSPTFRRKSRPPTWAELGRWLFLPLPRFPLRPGWPRLQVAACASEPASATALVRVGRPCRHRRRSGESMMSKFMEWIDARFPATKMWEDHLSKYYAPKNFNFLYFFGSLALLVLVNQIVTGVWLTMSFTPSAEEAFASVEYIMRDVEYG